MSEFLFWFLRPIAEMLGAMFAMVVVLALIGFAAVMYVCGVYAREWLRRRMFEPRTPPSKGKEV